MQPAYRGLAIALRGTVRTSAAAMIPTMATVARYDIGNEVLLAVVVEL
jgi:hypothetical protein